MGSEDEEVESVIAQADEVQAVSEANNEPSSTAAIPSADENTEDISDSTDIEQNVEKGEKRKDDDSNSSCEMIEPSEVLKSQTAESENIDSGSVEN
jgi:hypothetical protein